MRERWRLVGVMLAAALGVALVAIVGVQWWTAQPSGRTVASSETATDADPEPGDEPRGPAAPTAIGESPIADDDPLAALQAPRGPWANVDLAAVRAAFPDNLYWTMSSPTRDPALIEWRERERDRWNLEYGKVLSNTATADEIQTYYAYRQRLSSDYVLLATHLLTQYGTQLPPRDAQLLKLAIELHLARLEEIPRQITEANERREAHDAARRAWQEQQRAFDEPPAE